MAGNGVISIALLLSCFLQFSHADVLFSTLPNSLVVTASPQPGQVLRAGEDKIAVTWVLNQTLAAGSDSSFKTIKVKLCYAPASQLDRGWRKTVDKLSKDKTCQFKIVVKPYNSANKTVQSYEWTVERDVPTASFFIRAYAFNADDDQVAYGQTTDTKKTTNLFQIQSITGRHVSLDIASACFSVFSVVSLVGFFFVDKRKAKVASQQR